MVSLTVYSVAIFSQRYLDTDSDRMDVKTFFYSWLFNGLCEHHHTTQTSKFKIFYNGASTMLNNVFNTANITNLFWTNQIERQFVNVGKWLETSFIVLFIRWYCQFQTTGLNDMFNINFNISLKSFAWVACPPMMRRLWWVRSSHCG